MNLNRDDYYIYQTCLKLLHSCSLGGSPEDCQLFSVRQMDMDDRLKWFVNLSEDERCKFYDRHMMCLTLKMKAMRCYVSN
jgi:hypothetical protein